MEKWSSEMLLLCYSIFFLLLLLLFWWNCEVTSLVTGQLCFIYRWDGKYLVLSVPICFAVMDFHTEIWLPFESDLLIKRYMAWFTVQLRLSSVQFISFIHFIVCVSETPWLLDVVNVIIFGKWLILLLLKLFLFSTQKLIWLDQGTDKCWWFSIFVQAST